MAKRKPLVVESTLSSATIAIYTDDATIGDENIVVLDNAAHQFRMTMPPAAGNANRVVFVVVRFSNGQRLFTQPGESNYQGDYLGQSPCVLVCDGTAWYVAAAF